MQETRLDSLTPLNLVAGENIAALRPHWMSACTAFDEIKAEQKISEAFSQYSPEPVCLELLFAWLSKIGEAWYRGGNSATRAFCISIGGTAYQHPDHIPSRPIRIVVALPPNEEHTLSSLLITFLLRRQGFDVIYLGADVPINNFRSTLETIQPKLIILIAQLFHTAASLLDMLEGQHAVPQHLLKSGYQFEFENLEDALRDLKLNF